MPTKSTKFKADIRKNVIIKDETGEKLVGMNLCILVFHSILECSKLLQIQDVFIERKETTPW